MTDSYIVISMLWAICFVPAIGTMMVTSQPLSTFFMIFSVQTGGVSAGLFLLGSIFAFFGHPNFPVGTFSDIYMLMLALIISAVITGIALLSKFKMKNKDDLNMVLMIPSFLIAAIVVTKTLTA